MNVSAYREGRVKVTPAIEAKILELVDQERDCGKKKKHPAKWYRAEVAKALQLVEKNNPSLRSYESRIGEIRNKIKTKNPIDEPWSIGSCIQYGIPPDIIPLLVQYRKDISNVATPLGQRDLSKTRLSIRKARWMAVLRLVVDDLLKKLYPGEPLKQMGSWSRIADEYARRERLAEVFSTPLDTHLLDGLLFVCEDLPDTAILTAMVGDIGEESYQESVSGLTKLISERKVRNERTYNKKG